MKKILSIDGGGVRGIIPAVVLDDIEKRTGKSISELFDLIAGTSVGGMLALGLAVPKNPESQNSAPKYSAKELGESLKRDLPTIFKRPFLLNLPFGQFLYRRYSQRGIESVLDNYFGEARLSDALADVLIPSYEIEQRSPEFFRSPHLRLGEVPEAPKDPHDDTPPHKNIYMKEAARASSAAPTYFVPKKIPSLPGYAFIDGGVFANNPAMCAYAEAKAIYADEEEFLFVSLGTGAAHAPINEKDASKWGHIGWARPMLDIMMDGSSDTVDYQLRQVVPPVNGRRRYFRFQAQLDGAGTEKLDNTDPFNLDKLEALGIDITKDPQYRKLLDELCDCLLHG